MSVVFLCGNKACGKTYFLNVLVSKYGVKGYDSDCEILKTTQYKTIRDLYNSIGEQRFRHLEAEILDKTVADCGKNTVVALGGGALHLIEKCNRIGKTVYLYQKADILFSRMEKAGLPSFIKSEEDFADLYKIRDEFYSKHCSCTIDLSENNEEKVCQTLLEMYLN